MKTSHWLNPFRTQDTKEPVDVSVLVKSWRIEHSGQAYTVDIEWQKGKQWEQASGEYP